MYASFLGAGGAVLLAFTKEESFFLVNNHFSAFGDVFFKLLTHVGDGLLFGLIILVLLFYSYRKALLGLVIFIASALIAQVLKLTYFDDVMRPVAHFGKDVDMHFVEGVARHVKNSFPSGHSTSVFALALFLVLVFNMRKTGWLMAIIAILVGYSRVYLAVHFPVDVYAGSFIGVVTALVIYTWLDAPFESKFGDKGFLNR
ncbi:MAG: phosphatase PAP2 family protein [Cyclobacteriaceae bacterium]|nr:phosphatase PAP2 family protein [Cyclobacteriaceae bacterium]